MTPDFTDHRGTITDVLKAPVDCVTLITSVAGAVRANHVHDHTAQHAYVVSGRMQTAMLVGGTVVTEEHGPGDMFHEPAGVPHAWKALTDCAVLAFKSGRGAGDAYEEDVRRLPEAEWLLR